MFSNLKQPGPAAAACPQYTIYHIFPAQGICRYQYHYSIANGELRSNLEDLSYEEKDEEPDAATLFDDFALRAAQYIDSGATAISCANTLAMLAKTGTG
ncbi:hypothetical protein [Chitinophaga sancti]|uniref:Uncharacterized protein n=1 Tax=Chitinophaga sancti TaxID=1004 RepID=A0ABZ0XFP0_9BACT|nr:hypothetical protein [Chitinophaga sancti]WQD65056.1 hypothetical protein U0033_11685 [Chitinophaga sancti]WQG89320.1 hypothetical protein SR876_30785 [Chitinophaga sancti]